MFTLSFKKQKPIAPEVLTARALAKIVGNKRVESSNKVRALLGETPVNLSYFDSAADKLMTVPACLDLVDKHWEQIEINKNKLIYLERPAADIICIMKSKLKELGVIYSE